MTKFKPEDIEKHFRCQHPGCPDFAIAFFVAEIAKKNWKGATLGMAVGITMQNVLRHYMTDYDQMLLVGIDRKEARRRVQPKVNAIIGSWKKQRAELIARSVEKRIAPREFATELLATDKIIMDRLGD
ncbi:DUF2293 domain-containing protein [Rhizobium sp. Nf11,1]|uniref:DUF2293 domain-containing protein n=1 Tax=Rhizobium sp. Nf11,1 TaxID=3404923 RepID=UPI003D32FD5A